MFYDKNIELQRAEEEVKKAIDSGVPIVDLEIFNCLGQLNISNLITNMAEYTYELYLNLVKEIIDLEPKLMKKFLIQLKKADVIDNQSMEKEDSFLISLYNSLEEKSAIDLLIENYGKKLNKDKLVTFHDNILKETSSREKIGLRTNNLKFVGSWENGNRKIQYFPILDSQINDAINEFLKFYNSNINLISQESDIFLKPIVYHGLLAALQLFKDGNTRFARTFQNVEIWGLFNTQLEKKLDLPVLYASRQYFPYRGEYRNLLKNIAINKDEEAWNNWISFNLKRLQESLYVDEQRIETIKHIIL